LFHQDVAASTNDAARNRLQEDPIASEPELPFAIWAERQTQGRGRAGRAWWSDDGSLTFTLAIDPASHGLLVEHEPTIALAAAVAVINAATAWKRGIPGLGIRWPNDVEVNGRKLCGILPEIVDTPRGRRLLVGIGLNVGTRFDQAPEEVRLLATSLAELWQEPLGPSARPALIRAILTQLGIVLPQLAADDPGLADRWQSLDLLRGKRVRIAQGNRILAGKALGIEASGALRFQPDGEAAVSLFGGQVLREPAWRNK
jgi:BirA family biotin operon repressor/biotin-[acetyl-CoA-carboxylase] ligase